MIPVNDPEPDKMQRQNPKTVPFLEKSDKEPRPARFHLSAAQTWEPSAPHIKVSLLADVKRNISMQTFDEWDSMGVWQFG